MLLHHILPSLVPPIDRSYTLRFFYRRQGLSISEKEAFREMYLEFHRIAVHRKKEILNRLGKNLWNTSETKIIDNAIIGFIWKNFPKNRVVERMGEIA